MKISKELEYSSSLWSSLEQTALASRLDCSLYDELLLLLFYIEQTIKEHCRRILKYTYLITKLHHKKQMQTRQVHKKKHDDYSTFIH